MIVGAFESSFPFRFATSAFPPATATPPTPSVPTPSAPSSTTLRNLKCGYPSKICTNERAWKRDGSLHRFCEEHRVRANSNQKRWAQRKARTKAEKATAASPTPDTVATATLAVTTEEYHVDESMLQATKPPMDFTDFDMTLDLLLKDASFWSPTAESHAPQWESDDMLPQTSQQQDDAMEAELWAALGLGNINMSL